MTLPHERTRALRWAFEMLPEIAAHPRVPAIQQARAAAFTRRYPSPAMVISWIEAYAPCIPAAEAEAIEAAGALFEELSRSACCPQDLFRPLASVQRHYPEPLSAYDWSLAAGGEAVTVWLQQEPPE